MQANDTARRPLVLAPTRMLPPHHRPQPALACPPPPPTDTSHPAANSQQPTANSQQPTANSQQPTANSQPIDRVPHIGQKVHRSGSLPFSSSTSQVIEPQVSSASNERRQPDHQSDNIQLATNQANNMKSIISIACLMLVVGLVSVEARPKRSVIYTAGVPVASHVAVASVPVVQQSHVVHHNPTTIVKTQQVQSGNHASYSYSSEVQSNPVVHTQTHAAVAHVPVVAHRYAAAAPVVAYPVAHSYYNYGYHPASYYSPYSYVIGK